MGTRDPEDVGPGPSDYRIFLSDFFTYGITFGYRNLTDGDPNVILLPDDKFANYNRTDGADIIVDNPGFSFKWGRVLRVCNQSNAPVRLNFDDVTPVFKEYDFQNQWLWVAAKATVTLCNFGYFWTVVSRSPKNPARETVNGDSDTINPGQEGSIFYNRPDLADLFLQLPTHNGQEIMFQNMRNAAFNLNGDSGAVAFWDGAAGIVGGLVIAAFQTVFLRANGTVWNVVTKF